MKTQLFVGESRPEKELFNPVYENGQLNKAGGGLWTSTYNENYGSDWLQWCTVESWGFGNDGIFPCWTLEVDPKAKILIIQNVEQLAWFYKLYGKKLTYDLDLMKLDFVEISKEYDAVHLTKIGERLTRHSRPYDLYGWDCESTFWLNWVFTEVKALGNRTFKNDIANY